MTEIIVTEKDERNFEIVVKEAEISTTHYVSLDILDYERLTGGKCSASELIKQSFLFLLEREGKESILRRFDLMEIARYFPEYEKEIKKKFK
tara:strand:+ start:1024 stop:1299 length:276 start_codon:yes stop_codon:yes gene_type:complete